MTYRLETEELRKKSEIEKECRKRKQTQNEKSIITIDTVENPLHLPLKVIQEYLKIDVIEMCKNDIETIKEKILCLENVDLVFNNKFVITSMVDSSTD